MPLGKQCGLSRSTVTITVALAYLARIGPDESYHIRTEALVGENPRDIIKVDITLNVV